MKNETLSRIGKSYPKNFTPDPEAVHNSYERFQTEKYGNVLPGSDEEPDEQNEFDLKDFSNESND